MEKIVVFGSNGLLGQSLVQKFHRNYNLVGASMEVTNFCEGKNIIYQSLDMINRNEMADFLKLHAPDIIINAAAYTDVDGCEKDPQLCWNTNVHAVQNIIDFTPNKNTVIVQLSTDYVFDGKDGWYRETDKPNPKGNYARSKYAAENIVSASAFEHIIARTQLLYGTGKKIKPSFPIWVMSRLKEKSKIKVVSDQVGNPTITEDLSEAIFRLLEYKEYGLFHISGKEVLTRYEWALKIADLFELDASLIEKVTTKELKQIAPRPLNSSFIIDKLVNKIDWEPGDVLSGLKRLKIMINENNG